MKINILLYFTFFTLLFLALQAPIKPPAVTKQPNSLGINVNANIILNKPPFSVSRCDQIVLFKGQLIPDFKDYRIRKDVTFTITAYHLNAFLTDNPESLIKSVLLTNGKMHPSDIRGARGCIQVDSGDSKNPMAVCRKNQSEADNIQEVLKYFSDCRGGIESRRSAANEEELVRKALRSCGLPKIIDPKKLKQELDAKKKKEAKKSDPIANATGFFHPGYRGVPGSK